MSKQSDFTALGLDPRLESAVSKMGFDTPTAVQQAAIPAAIQGKDVLGCAQTGSGKTAAFVLPVLERLLTRHRGATRALVLVPTRELAAQVEEHFRDLAADTDISVASIYGGVAMGPQVSAFKRGTDILVATPGRLMDHMSRDHGGLEALEVLVLDEADRMLDMGFLPAIRKIIRQLPDRPRQTFLFSATMPPAIKRLADEMLRNAIQVSVERKQAPAEAVKQALYPVPQKAKVALLLELLDRDEVGNAIVFTRTKHRANRVAQKLEKKGVAAARIHGNRSQKQRTAALEGFRQGRYRVLVATDILARGIDVEDLDHVVNFDVPATPEDYIHRVGRTGRAAATGDAYTFFAPEENDLIRAIERKVGNAIERRKLDGFDYGTDQGPLEVPLQERIARMREERARGRERAAEKNQRKARAGNGGSGSGGSRSGSGEGGGNGRGGRRGGRRRRGGRSSR